MTDNRLLAVPTSDTSAKFEGTCMPWCWLVRWHGNMCVYCCDI